MLVGFVPGRIHTLLGGLVHEYWEKPYTIGWIRDWVGLGGFSVGWIRPWLLENSYTAGCRHSCWEDPVSVG